MGTNYFVIDWKKPHTIEVFDSVTLTKALVKPTKS